MGLTREQIEAHLDKWTEALKNPESRDYRSKWTRFLFRHEPLDNAVKIIQSGRLLSRAHAKEVDHLDIAPSNVISFRTDAHNFSRLYFRPRNPTQYRVEGIRKLEDLYQGDPNAHAPVLIMFMFSARTVLALPNTYFSNGNMQSPNTSFGNTYDFFQTIPFEHVFHDGPYDVHSAEGEQIVKARCAEVLATSPLELHKHLSAIMCRSEAERRTLLHMCGPIPPEIRSKIKVFNEVGIFQSQFAYVKSVDLSSNGLRISLNARKDSRQVAVRLEVYDEERQTAWARVNNTMKDPAKTLTLTKYAPDGKYLVNIWLDDHLAYKAISSVDSLPF